MHVNMHTELQLHTNTDQTQAFNVGMVANDTQPYICQ